VLKYAARLRSGEEVSDAEFDEVYTPEVKSISFLHWSPVAVARRAAILLAEAGATRVLDVGAGPGKFCVVGALATSVQFTGIEQRRNLVDVAMAAAIRFGVERAHFVHANIVDFDWDPFNGFYFYNPFQEQIEDDDIFAIDETLERSPELRRTYVASTIAKLVRAPIGSAVVTYCGFGGMMPSQYRRVHREEFQGARLALWVKEGYSTLLPQRVRADLTSLDDARLPAAKEDPEAVALSGSLIHWLHPGPRPHRSPRGAESESRAAVGETTSKVSSSRNALSHVPSEIHESAAPNLRLLKGEL